MNTERRPLLVVFIAFIAISAIWLYWPKHMAGLKQTADLGPKDQLSAMGQLGDSYGSFTSLLTALTFLGVAYGLYVQEMQLRIAKREAEEERRARQVDGAERQFFQMLRIMESHVAQLGERPFHGIEALRVLSSNALSHGRTFVNTGDWDDAKKKAEIQKHLASNIDKEANHRTAVQFFESLDLYLRLLLSHPQAIAEPLAKLLVAGVTPNVILAAALRVACNGTDDKKKLWIRFSTLSDFTARQGPLGDFIVSRLQANQ